MTTPGESNKNGEPSKNLDEELVAMLKYLRLGRLLSHWDETLAEARKGRYSAERLLKYVLEEEYRAKRENARLLRRQRANIPEMLEMETFPFPRQPKLDRKKIMSYYDSFDYMTKQRNMVWLGPTGCGKTGLATAFLLQAIDRGYRGYFVTFPRVAPGTLPVAGRPQRGEGAQALSLVRLPGDRRSGLRGSRTGAGGTVLYADAQAAQEEDDAHHLQPGLLRMGIVSAQQALDGRLDRSTDRKQSRHQHEGR